MELKDTVNMMLSDDYKQRFVAEYVQIVIRREKLAHFIENSIGLFTNPRLYSNPYTCTYRSQLSIMDAYINTLNIRAIDENIKLPTRKEIMGWT